MEEDLWDPSLYKKLLVTRALLLKKLLAAPGSTTRNKKLLVTRASLLVANSFRSSPANALHSKKGLVCADVHQGYTRMDEGDQKVPKLEAP